MTHTSDRDEHATKAELLREVETLRQQLATQEQEVVRAQETLDAASRANHKLFANISHDIRTPMNAILGIAELLMDTPLSEEQQEFVRIFHMNSDMLLQMLNNLIGFSEAGTREITLAMTDFDLLTLVETTCEFLAPRAHRKNLELNYYLDPSFPTFLQGDSARLRQIFINLIGNAIKFTEEGEVMLHCECLSEDDECVEWLFSISDTGIGIPKPRLARIVESLSHSERSLFKLGADIELGLAISKHLVELMEGRIWVESEDHHGTTFHFTATFPRQKEPSKPLRIYPERLKGLQVLVVDDNATNRSILKTILQRWGAKVAEVNNGRQGALELQRAHRAQKPYDLILLDSAMPNVDGFQMAEHIHDDPTITSLPIMMLTANDRQELLEKTDHIDISAYMVKPVKRFELLHAIGTALQRPSPSEASLKISSEANSDKKLRILLVEDYTHNQVIVQQYLKGTPHHLDIAENGAIAVEKFSQTTYDFILMDMQMPVMDGYEATRRIREAEKQRGKNLEEQMNEEQPVSPIPIIALTAYALQDDLDKSLQAGCNDYLSKPLKKSRLFELLAIYCKDVQYTDMHEKNSSKPALDNTGLAITPGRTYDRDDPQELYLISVPQEFAEYIPEFIQEVRQDIETMTMAFARHDYQVVHSLSHRIKGAGGGYGLTSISDIAQKIEMAARQKDRETIQQWLRSLTEYLEMARISYRTVSGEIKTIL